jgi:hypothetical protein
MTAVRSYLGPVLLVAAIGFLAVRSVLPTGARERKPLAINAGEPGAHILGEPGALATGVWLDVFNGRDLSGWKHLGGGRACVRDGQIVLENDADRRTGYLVSNIAAKDFKAEVRCRIVRGDSGLYFRAHAEPRTPTEIMGTQVQLNWETGRGLGGLFETHGRGWLCRPHAEVPRSTEEDWLDIELDVAGSRVRVAINGVETADFDDADPANRFRNAGRLAFQIHGGCFCTVYIKSIRVWIRE